MTKRNSCSCQTCKRGSSSPRLKVENCRINDYSPTQMTLIQNLGIRSQKTVSLSCG